MNSKRISLEQALYALALALALGLRLIPLGLSTLNETEAALALQSAQLLRGSLEAMAPHPLYILATVLLSFVFGASTFIARFLPALAGTALVALPYLLRRRLGRRAALILSFFIALDPGILGSSVQAGSSLIGPVCILFALAGWVLRRPVMAGICAGLAVLGGPGIWPGLIGLAIAASVAYSNTKSNQGGEPFDWRLAGLSAVACLVLSGTLLLFVPAGINAAAASLPAYIAGWGTASGTSILLMVGALLSYEVLALVLAAGGAIRGLSRETSRLDLFLCVWWAAALILALAYPARQVMDLIWVIFPMLGLAARQLDRMLNVHPSERLATTGQAALILLLLLLLVNLAISWPQSQLSSAAQAYRWIVLALALLLLVAESALVGWGWSAKIAVSGFLWGVSGLLALYTLSAGMHAAGLSERTSAELWRSGPAFSDADLLVSTVEDYTQWTPALGQAPQIVITGIASPAVEWALRDFAGLKVEEILPPAAQPEMLVTGDDGEIEQAAAYTGQDFTLASSPAWDLIAPAEWINWLFYRQVQADAWRTTRMILWVRSDRFPGAAGQTNQP